MGRLSRNYLDGSESILFSDMPGTGNACYAIPDDDYFSVLMFHREEDCGASRETKGSFTEPLVFLYAIWKATKKHPEEKNTTPDTDPDPKRVPPFAWLTLHIHHVNCTLTAVNPSICQNTMIKYKIDTIFASW